MEKRNKATADCLQLVHSYSGYWYEEPCEGRLSRTVLWERGGEIPLRDPIVLKDYCPLQKKE